MTFHIETQVVLPGLLHLYFENQYEVTSTFLRLQEFYESDYPEIKGKFFTLEQYMDCYAKDKGNFTYTCDWSGFNVPGHVIEAFAQTFAKDLLQKEKELLRIILQHVEENEWSKYYVIGSSKDGGKHKDARDVMRHEIAHGLYYLNDEYKKEMKGLAQAAQEEHPKFAKTLRDLGYCDEVIDDEIQAYLSTSTMIYLADDLFEDQEINWETILEAQRTFEHFYEELVE